MNSVQENSSRLFERFVGKLAAVDLRNATAIPAVIGVVTFFAGAALEAHGQSGLLEHGGLTELASYKAALAAQHLSSVGEMLHAGLEGKLLSFGGNTQIRGFALMTVAPLVSAASVALARGFTNLKASLNDKLESIREFAGSARSDKEVDQTRRAPNSVFHQVPCDEEIACALASLGEDMTSARVEQIRQQMSAMSAKQAAGGSEDLVARVDAARRAVDEGSATRPTNNIAPRGEFRFDVGDDSLSPAM